MLKSAENKNKVLSHS